MLFSKDSRKYLYEHIYVGFDLSDYNPLEESDEICQILEIQNALRTKNFEKYFLMLEDESTDYVLACLMVHNIEAIRRQIATAVIPNFRCLGK